MPQPSYLMSFDDILAIDVNKAARKEAKGPIENKMIPLGNTQLKQVPSHYLSPKLLKRFRVTGLPPK